MRTALRNEGKQFEKYVNYLVTMNLFVTINNPNFDRKDIIKYIEYTLSVKQKLISKISDTNKLNLPEMEAWNVDKEKFNLKAASIGVLATQNEDISSLRELITYELRGLATYIKHANILLYDNEEVDVFIRNILSILKDDKLKAGDLLDLAIHTGKFGVEGVALLDKANTESYGNSEITSINIGVGKNPGILISGHDLLDLEMLLEQTQGSGVDVYTHSEMLPTHYYPAFKKYPNFIENYGNA